MVNIEEFKNRYKSQIKRIYELVDENNKLLTELPIDILNVEINVDELCSLDETVLERINQEYADFVLAEDAIVFTNRYRGHLSTVDDILNQAELYFYKTAEFKKAYETAVSAEKLVSEQTKSKDKRK